VDSNARARAPSLRWPSAVSLLNPLASRKPLPRSTTGRRSSHSGSVGMRPTMRVTRTTPWLPTIALPELAIVTVNLNPDTLLRRFNTTTYLSRYSDVAAVMVLEHQTHMTN
jgi:hypothetical protein